MGKALVTAVFVLAGFSSVHPDDVEEMTTPAYLQRSGTSRNLSTSMLSLLEKQNISHVLTEKQSDVQDVRVTPDILKIFKTKHKEKDSIVENRERYNQNHIDDERTIKPMDLIPDTKKFRNFRPENYETTQKDNYEKNVDILESKPAVLDQFPPKFQESTHPQWTSPTSGVKEPFLHTWPKYLSDSVRTISAFPEVLEDIKKGQRTSDLLTDVKSHAPQGPEDKLQLPRFGDASIPGLDTLDTTTPSVHSAENKHEQPSEVILGLGEFGRQASDEPLFQSWPLYKSDALRPIKFFPEEYTKLEPENGKDNAHNKKEDYGFVLPQETGEPYPAGPSLNPSSIFEKELRVPFF